jgi:hypothetical protein
MDIAALRLLHKLIQFGDVVLDRAGQRRLNYAAGVTV